MRGDVCAVQELVACAAFVTWVNTVGLQNV
jgi:hypothetical protein